MEEQLAALIEQNAKLSAQLERVLIENRLLHKKVQLLLKRMFGRKSEKLDRAQLELLLGQLDAVTPEDDDPPPSGPTGRRKSRERRPRLPEDLPTEDIMLEPEEVKESPQDYKRIGEEVTQELDVVPARYFRRRYIRPKYVKKSDRQSQPVIAPLPDRIIEGGYASPGLLTDIVLKKYVDHLPLHRQEQILRSRHGIELSRKTMSDWVRVVADWLKPIYNHIRADLVKTGYLQVDESPVRYCQKEGGGSGQGYLWVYHHPGGDVLYEWHTGRGTECLDDMLGGFSGTVQCDGYSAYRSYAKGREEIALACCWAHARRKFDEAKEEAPKSAGWFLNQIRLLYAVETRLKQMKAGPDLREAVRCSESRMIAERIGEALKIQLGKHLPKSRMGLAIAYTLRLWDPLMRSVNDGQLQIDNNPVENAIRPTAVGKKNWLFFGNPEAGQRSAVIYTVLETCKRHGINPQEYLKDLLSALPTMTNQQTHEWTPAAWAGRRKARVA